MIDDLQILLAVTRAGTLTAAASLLRTTPSTISRRLTALERQIGASLLQRSTRSIALTQVGQALVDRVAPLVRELEQVRANVTAARHEPSGLLRISAATSFGGRFVAPLLGQFRHQWTRVSLDFRLEDRVVDPAESDIDVAVRVGPPPEKAWRSLKLASLHRVTCASPTYLDRRGRPKHPDELADHECIVVTPAERRNGIWRFADGVTHRPRSQFVVNTHETAAAAARGGAGIAFLPSWMAHPECAQGVLERVLSEFEQGATGGAYVLWRDGASAAAHTFVELLRRSILAEGAIASMRIDLQDALGIAQ